MNIRQLKQFVAIAQSGNISRAAKEQNISQPALTRSLKNLEQDLGVDLIERRANGVFLTPYGEHLLGYAHCIVSDSERVRREINAMKMGRRGQLSIGVGPAFSSKVLSPAINQLLSQGSQLEVRLVEGFVEDLCAQLRTGALDVVLSLFPDNCDVSDLSFSQLCEVESVLISGPDHKLASVSRNISRDDLARCNWVIADQKSAANSFREYLNRTEIPKDVHHIRASSLRLIKSLVLESDYLSILPRILVEKEIQNGELKALSGPAKPLVTIGGIAWRSSGFRSPALRDFIDIIERQFADGVEGQPASGNVVTALFQ